MLCVLFGQGQEFSSQTVSGLPGGAAHSAGVGQRGAATTDHQPGRQLCIWPVSPRNDIYCTYDVFTEQFKNASLPQQLFIIFQTSFMCHDA